MLATKLKISHGQASQIHQITTASSFWITSLLTQTRKKQQFHGFLILLCLSGSLCVFLCLFVFLWCCVSLHVSEDSVCFSVSFCALIYDFHSNVWSTLSVRNSWNFGQRSWRNSHQTPSRFRNIPVSLYWF